MLIDEIKPLIVKCKKEKDTIRVHALQEVLAVLETEQKNNKNYTTDIENKAIIGIVRQYKKAIETMIDSPIESAQKLVQEYQEELKIIQEFAPKEVTNEELTNFINTFILESNQPIKMKDIMSAVKKNYPTSDGKVVAQILKNLI